MTVGFIVALVGLAVVLVRGGWARPWAVSILAAVGVVWVCLLLLR